MSEPTPAEIGRLECEFLAATRPEDERAALARIDALREEDAFHHPDFGRSRRYNARAQRRRRVRLLAREFGDGYW